MAILRKPPQVQQVIIGAVLLVTAVLSLLAVVLYRMQSEGAAMQLRGDIFASVEVISARLAEMSRTEREDWIRTEANTANTNEVVVLLSADKQSIVGPSATLVGIREAGISRWLVKQDGDRRSEAEGMIIFGETDQPVLIARTVSPYWEPVSLTQRIIWLTGIFVFVPMAGWFMLSWRRQTQLLQAFSSACSEAGRGKFSVRAPVSGDGSDLDTAAQSVNAMIERIGQLFKALDEQSDLITHELKHTLYRMRKRCADELSDTDTNIHNSADAALFEIDRQCSRMISAMDAMLQLAEIRGGPRETQCVDLTELAHTAIDSHKMVADGKGLTLNSAVAPATILGDQSLMYILFDNLLGNAIKYTPSGGIIDVSVRSEANPECDSTLVVLVVEDSGPGVPADDREAVFEVGRRGSNVGTTQGNGFGLATVKAIVDRHGGTICIEDPNNSHGGGTRFVVRLPSIAQTRTLA